MAPQDVTSCAQTCTLVTGLQASSAKQLAGNTFWSSCAAGLYTSAQSSPAQLATFQSTSFRGLAASSSSGLSFSGSKQVRPPTQLVRSSEMGGLPCPMLYQAKEPEAISDVLRRAGKKALGGGIPGECFGSFTSDYKGAGTLETLFMTYSMYCV